MCLFFSKAMQIYTFFSLLQYPVFIFLKIIPFIKDL